MIFEFKNNQFDTPQRRQEFAQRLTHIIDGDPDFKAYIPPGNNDYRWCLDRGNDWKVQFYETNPQRFSVTYRYQSRHARAEESLGEWLKYRLHCTPIE